MAAIAYLAIFSTATFWAFLFVPDMQPNQDHDHPMAVSVVSSCIVGGVPATAVVWAIRTLFA